MYRYTECIDVIDCIRSFLHTISCLDLQIVSVREVKMSLWRAAFPNLWRSVGNPRVAKTWAENSKVRVRTREISKFSGSREREKKDMFRSSSLLVLIFFSSDKHTYFEFLRVDINYIDLFFP